MTTSSGFEHIGLTYVVPVYFDRPDHSVVVERLGHYAGLSSAVLDRLQFVLVDDASPSPPSIPSDLQLNLLVLRVAQNIPWNQPGARNLGVTFARSDKVLMTDLDHQLDEGTLARLIEHSGPGRTIYKFRRVDQDGRETKPHPNTFFMSRGRFLALYGYDEDFCGHYGHDDTTFLKWQKANGSTVKFLGTGYGCARASGADEHGLERDASHNDALARSKERAWSDHGLDAGHSRRFLSFDFEVVCDYRRPKPELRKRDKRRLFSPAS